MTPREWKATRKSIWSSTAGCECKLLIKGWRKDRAPATRRDVHEVVRCNRRMRRINKDLDKFGPESVPSSKEGG